MKVNELRIGNLLYFFLIDGTKTPVNISCDHLTWCSDSNILFNSLYKPIPLKEWILKLGSKEIDDFSKECGRQAFMISKVQDEDLILLYRSDIGLSFNILRHIQYVHELQNIFYALTGEELVFNSKE